MDDWSNGILSLWRHEYEALKAAFNGQFAEVSEAVLVYSFAISIVWSISGFISWLIQKRQTQPAIPREVPAYTVLIPFHGEAEGALRTAWSLAAVTPQPAEIILIDDGSAEASVDAHLPSGARIVRFPARRGKAGALKDALSLAGTEIVVCLDADTQAQTLDWHAMLGRFGDPQLGAVTGKIWGHSNGSIAGRMQEIDYIAVISLIKAAETLWGGLLTVSGAFVAFRKSALEGVGSWDTDKAAEDIDISWRLQIAGWRVDFDIGWTAAVEMAPNIPALWRQRRRWSSGLGQALYDHGVRALLSGSRHLPSVVITLTNTLWIVLMLAIVAAAAWQLASQSPQGVAQLFATLDVPRAAALGSALFCIQFLVATCVDGRPWSAYWRLIPLLPLYPLYFWCILCTSFLFGFSRGMLRRNLGVWQPTVRAPELERN